ncbi:reverse transcriptase domain-containing protein [Tanacetum coccineum]
MTPPPGFSTPPQIPNITTSERPPITTIVFSATTPENTPFAYHASTSTNPNPTISPAFVEANYEIYESLLRERRRQIRNEDLRTELEYFSEDYDEEREMEPRPEPHREATPTLRLRSFGVRRQRERVVGFEDAPNKKGNMRGGNVESFSQPLRSSSTSVQGGHQPSTNMGGNLPPNGTLLSHHAQPFIPSSLYIPTGLMPIHVNPYSQPSSNPVHGQVLNFPFQTQIGNPPAVGTFTYHLQRGYISHDFTNNNVPSYNGPMHPTVTPLSSYPFYTQPMYAPPNMSAYPNPAGPFADSAGFVTPLVRWIEDYPLSDELKMPSHIGSYDGKGDPVLAPFQRGYPHAEMVDARSLPHVHIYPQRYTDNTLQILGLHEEQRISGFVYGLRIRSLFEHLFTDLPSTYKGLMGKTYTWVEVREVATNGASNDRRDSFERSKKSSWDNNRGQKNKDRFSPYRGPNHGLLPSLSKSPKEILATEKAARSFEPPPKMFGSKRSQDMSKYCYFHEDYGHDTNDCRHLITHIQEAVNSEFIKLLRDVYMVMGYEDIKVLIKLSLKRSYGFYTWVEAREVATNGASNGRRDSFERSKKSSWDNNRGQKNKDRFSPYRGPNHGLLPSLSKSPKEILATEKAARSFEPPPKMFERKRSRDMSKCCHFNEDYGHDTNDCRHLRTHIQEAVNSGQLSHLVKGIKKERIKSSDTPRGESRKDKGKAPVETPILMVGRVYMDGGSSCEIIYESFFKKLNTTIKATKVGLKTPLVGFSGERSWSVGKVPLEITIGDSPLSRTETLNFVIVRSDSPHNMMLGRTAMQRMGIVVSTIHGAIKFHTEKEIRTVLSTYEANEGTKRAKKIPATSKERVLSCVNAEEKIIVNDKYPDQMVTIGKQLPDHFKKELQNLLKSNADVFAWTHADMTGISRTIMVEGKPFNTEHKLNEYSHIKPIKQNKRSLGPDCNMAACKETEELIKVGIL